MKSPRFTALLAAFVTLVLSAAPLFAQADEHSLNDLGNDSASTGSAIGGIIGGLIGLAVALLMVISMWKIFTKAGKPGWASLIPFYNYYVIIEIVGRPGWWLILLFIPFVNFIIILILLVDLAKSFGKGVGFALGLIFLSVIFFPVLAFSDAKYTGPAAAPRLPA